MPGVRCAVFGCNNNHYTKRATGQDIIFHTFPKAKDMVSQTMRNEWINRCKREDKFNPDNSRICSKHFVETDYERDLQNELLGLPLRKIFKKTAVPTVGLPSKSISATTSNVDSDRSKRLLKRQRHQEVKELMTDSNNEKNLKLDCDNSPLGCPTTSLNKPEDEKYDKLLKKFNDLKSEHIKMKQTIGKKIKALRDQLKYFKTKSYRSPKSTNSEKSQILLKKVLTDNQIALLSGKKKRVNWTRDEIAVAFTLRYYSKKCYLYLRTKLHYPLPSLSSLRKWASQIDVSQGILKDVLLMLSLAEESFSEFEKTVVIQFDEVKVKSVQEYDISKDEVLGPCNQMQVVMARGLFAQWKQPLYIAFDQKITKEILFEIVTELHKISYNVVACVSDCGASNMGLWKELGINVDNTSFEHPVTKNSIYMFADAPHLLKLIRNWLLDVGFLLEDGSIINKTPLQVLVSTTDTEVRPNWKVSQKHLDCVKSQRQHVRLAAQLLSNTVSTCLLRYKPGTDKQMAETLGNFIRDINLWFDIFNSYCVKGKVPSKNAYGVSLEDQEKHLDKMLYVISSMRAIGKNALQTFQKGMIISMKSLKSLYYDMKSKLDIKYICTHRLNQDSLENFFFQVRSRGGPDEHPSPLTAIYRIRMIMLGKNPGILGSKVNTESKTTDEYIVSKVLETANVNIVVENVNESTESKSSSFSSSTSSNESMTTSDFSPTSHEITNDALEYIAGYIAKKYKDKIPNLGHFTYKLKENKIPSWVQQLSYGGLIKPTDHWLKKIKKWNYYFQIHHGESLRKGPGIVRHLALKIFKKENDIPFSVIKDFSKLRTIIRMNFNNLKAKYTKTMKRKSLDSDLSRTKRRKLSKITN